MHAPQSDVGESAWEDGGMWPVWPPADESIVRALTEVVASRRWAISGAYTGSESFERRFGQAFADYHGVRHAVPTCNGSAALTIALQAVGVGPGDEVLVPGMTWVACAAAVLRCGARPVPVDVCPDTLCMSPDAAAAAMTLATSAVVLVHAYCSVADVEAFVRLAETTGVPLIEDCSQAHGAEWRERRVGTFGSVGIFSLQQTKVLTAGEGGVAITEDPALADRMEQLRADGRRWSRTAPRPGALQLEEVGDVVGTNYCLSEFGAAVALNQLSALDSHNATRAARAKVLDDVLAGVPGVVLTRTSTGTTSRSFYRYVFRLSPDVWPEPDVDALVHDLQRHVNLPVQRLDAPFTQNRLLRNAPSRRATVRHRGRPLPVADAAYATGVAVPHWALLADESQVAVLGQQVGASLAGAGRMRPDVPS